MPPLEKLTEPPIKDVWQIDPETGSIDLGTHACKVSCGDKSASLSLQAEIKFDGRPRTSFYSRDGQFPASSFAAFSDEESHWSIQFDETSQAVDAFILSAGFNREFKLAPSKSAFAHRRDDEKLKRGVFHLLNFPELMQGNRDYTLVSGSASRQAFKRCGRVEMEAGDYRITLVNTSDAKEQLKTTVAAGGYAISGLGEIQRLDGRPFSVEEFESVLTKVHWILSFALGRWSGLCLPVAYDGNGERTYEEWGTRFQSTGLRVTGDYWFYEGAAAPLSDAASCLFDLLDREPWVDELHRIIWWYISANNRGESMACDMAIVHAQAALEALAWIYCVQDQKMLSPDAFKTNKLLASDKLRLLLVSLGIPTDIPANLDALAKLCPKPFADSPHAISELRNDVVHPKQKHTYEGGEWYDCLRLALWQIELVILSLSGYRGRYCNRLGEGVVGMRDKVPWAPESE